MLNNIIGLKNRDTTASVPFQITMSFKPRFSCLSPSFMWISLFDVVSRKPSRLLVDFQITP